MCLSLTNNICLTVLGKYFCAFPFNAGQVNSACDVGEANNAQLGDEIAEIVIDLDVAIRHAEQ